MLPASNSDLTVTFTGLVHPDHCVGVQLPPLLLYHLSAVKPLGGLYDAPDSPAIDSHELEPFGDHSHWKVVAPPSLELLMVLGSPL